MGIVSHFRTFKYLHGLLIPTKPNHKTLTINYLSINSIRTIGPTLSPLVWLSYTAEKMGSNFHWLWI